MSRTRNTHSAVDQTDVPEPKPPRSTSPGLEHELASATGSLPEPCVAATRGSPWHVLPESPELGPMPESGLPPVAESSARFRLGIAAAVDDTVESAGVETMAPGSGESSAAGSSLGGTEDPAELESATSSGAIVVDSGLLHSSDAVAAAFCGASSSSSVVAFVPAGNAGDGERLSSSFSFLCETRRRFEPMMKPLRLLIASSAAAGPLKLTKPKPRLRPVSRSTIIRHETISP